MVTSQPIDEYNREERIETYYQGWGARDMAERIVALEDELGADVDGVCTGMHADVAEAWDEIERLRDVRKALWALVRGSLRGRQTARASARRYRLAWTSARRRAADEANFAMEALELRDQEIARLRAALQRESTHAAESSSPPHQTSGPVSPITHV